MEKQEDQVQETTEVPQEEAPIKENAKEEVQENQANEPEVDEKIQTLLRDFPLKMSKGNRDVQDDIYTELKELPVNESVRLGAVNYYNLQKKQLDTQMNEEIRVIQQKYDILSQPIVVKQNEIIMGTRKITEEETKFNKEFITKEDQKKEQKQVLNKAEPIKEYWMRCLQHGEETAPDVKEKDDDCLGYLRNVRAESKLFTKTNEWKNDMNTFTLFFEFNQNPYFTNEVLTKTIIINDDEESEETKGCTINWKEGKNLTKKQIKKSQKNKKTGQKRVVNKEVDDPSFFDFFKDTNFKEEEDDNEEEEKEESLHDIHVDVGRFIFDDLIPYSLEHYLDVKQKEGDEDDKFDDDFDDDVDMDKESEEETTPKKKKGKKKKKNSENSGGQEEKPECKQQ